MMPLSLTIQENHIAVITLQQPENLNAFSSKTMDLWLESFQNIGQNPQIRCVIIQSSVKRSFTSGGNLNEEILLTKETARLFAFKGQSCIQAVLSCPVPVIFSIHGYCLGAGLELLLGGDIIIAADDAKIGIPTLRFGTTPAFGSVQWLCEKIGRQNTMDLLLTGKTLTTEEALHFGLIQYVVPREKLQEKTMGIAEQIAALPPQAVIALKQILYSQSPNTAQLELETDIFTKLCETPERNKRLLSFLSNKK